VDIATSDSRPHRNSFPLLFTSVDAWTLTPQLIRTLSIRASTDAYEGCCNTSFPTKEVMTHIDVSDDNSTPEQNMVRADRVEFSPAF
jgi:hypothetical protein